MLKFGLHGGYHGHYDRLSLASFFKDGRTFGNTEHTWYGYNSFLFKMWVQTSIAHNMVVVDGRMQEPSPCECVLFEDKPIYSAVCAQTTARWCDPPYGGQTPYLPVFPEEKCEAEGRYILYPAPEQRRPQGAIGEYSDPVFQRRLLLLFHGYCLVWDYLSAEEEHTYDCLYHPHGKYLQGGQQVFLDRYTERYAKDPFGAGQFIFHCHWGENKGVKRLSFTQAQGKQYSNEIMDYTPASVLWRAYPSQGEIMVGKYPERDDTFRPEDMEAKKDFLEKGGKKTVCFRQKGKAAKFVTALEIGDETGLIGSIDTLNYDTLIIREKDGSAWEVCVSGMDSRTSIPSIAVKEVRPTV